MGSQGMPRRYATYLAEWQHFHVLSTIGAGILGAGIALMFGYLIFSLFSDRKAEKNPWGAATLDFTDTESPPVLENFEQDPIVTRDPYDYTLIIEEAKAKAAAKQA